MEEKDLSKKLIWSGTYKSINFEIVNWSYKDPFMDEMKQIWNFYLILPIDMFPEKLHKEIWLPSRVTEYGSVMYGYYNSNILSSIDFYGGITYYEKVNGYDGGKKVIKVGCDYNHAWDQDCYYDIKDIIEDTKIAINSLFETVDGLLMRCYWDGKFYPESEGYLLRDGSFISCNRIKEIIKHK